MWRIAFVCVLVFAGLSGPSAAAAADGLFRQFDAAAFTTSERRLLQAAMAEAGDYRGPLDGAWTDRSQSAIEGYALREYGVAALNAHAGALVLGFLDAVGRDGWDFSYLPELGVSLALPLDALTAPEAEEGGERRWSRDGTLTLLTHRFNADDAARWHGASRRANSRADALVVLRDPDLMVTSGVLADGRGFYTRSDRTAGGWSTVYVAAGRDEAGRLDLIASSIRPGRPEPWDLPRGGTLGLLARETSALLDRPDARAAAHPTPAVLTPRAAGLPEDQATSTGTGFYVSSRVVVTAGHVVEGCPRVALADGTELSVVASDADLDVAALMTPERSRNWLTLASGKVRLGQRVHAAGFPYYSIAGTSLNLTSGNVSALAGVDDDRRFFSFTAPVQPGNSGGPLIDARGSVLGLVVARLSEDYIVEATGSLPQNINYALREDELADFLRRSGVAAADGGLDRFDMDDGAPDGFEQAVVPILCR
ncbi:MAG: serine protease [Amaricoccus sp.]